MTSREENSDDALKNKLQSDPQSLNEPKILLHNQSTAEKVAKELSDGLANRNKYQQQSEKSGALQKKNENSLAQNLTKPHSSNNYRAVRKEGEVTISNIETKISQYNQNLSMSQFQQHKENGDDLEKNSWNIHKLHKDTSSSSCYNDIAKEKNIALCYLESKDVDKGHKHFFLIFETSQYTAEIDCNNIYDATFKLSKIPSIKSSDEKVSDTFEFTAAMKERLQQVENTKNYSLMLRNCEHVTKYVVHGAWYSYQVGKENSIFFRHYQNMRLINEQALGLINTPPDDLFSSEQSKFLSLDSFLQNSWSFKADYPQKQSIYIPKKDSFNVVLLGPTGAGKSNIINYIFQQVVAVSKPSVGVVTDTIDFYRGVFQSSTKNKKHICLIDTDGFCDQNNANDGILLHAFHDDLIEIHRIVFIVGDRFRPVDLKLIEDYQKKFNFAENSDSFTFILTKCDDYNADERNEFIEDTLKLKQFQNFAKDGKGKSMLTEETINFRRIITVGLKPFNKLKQGEFSSAKKDTMLQIKSDRENMIKSIFWATNSSLSLKPKEYRSCLIM